MPSREALGGDLALAPGQIATIVYTIAIALDESGSSP